MAGSRRRVGLVAGGVVLAIVLMVIVVVIGWTQLGIPLSEGTAGGSPIDGTFPSAVAGLPVLSVAQAVDKLGSGQLDGQAIAVAGYYNAFYPSCPYPGRYIGPLERWCDYSAFTDAKADARLCEQPSPNETSCHQTAATNLAPFFMSETSGSPGAWLTGGATGSPAAFVLIGHVGDPRQWQCTVVTRADCGRAFVVDRIAWAEGKDVPAAAPETGDMQSGGPITPRLTLAQATAAAGATDTLVTAAPFRAGDLATIDPRWTRAGDDVVWFVRSLDPASAPAGAQTVPETAALVDDATGKLLVSEPLKVDPAYRPAQLWPIATLHGVDCCAGNLMAFDRVAAADGTIVHEGLVSGGSTGTAGSTTFGGGYGSLPLVLPAGDYTLTSWAATFDRGVMGAPIGECSSRVTLQPLDVVALKADFPSRQPCTLGPALVPAPG
jgi:hypothetical protein